MLLYRNLRVATMAGETPYGLIEKAAVLVDGDTIRWVGPEAEAPAAPARDCGGRLMTPGLIDCHTHIVYGGNRAHEFELRLTGKSYAEIAAEGGGIAATVRATRAADAEALFAAASRRLDGFLAEGVTTLEIKSGYGLDVETEVRMLQVARRLGRDRPVDVVTSYLGAHTFPPEYRDRRAEYLALVIEEAMPAVARAGLADAVDGFCEGIAFSPAETEAVFTAARALGLRVKLHADQLSDLGGAALAARFGALSADHIEYTSEAGVAAMAGAGTVGVLLPGAFYYLRERQPPPVALLRRYGVPMAVASDINPGSSPLHSLLAAMNMACVLFGLTPEEALRGVTAHAARALGLADRGRIAPGLKADLVLWDAERPGDLAYPLGHVPLAAVIKAGTLVRGGLD